VRSGFERLLVGLGALAGFAGVGLSAAAAHLTGGGSLDVAARILLAHAPALVALAAAVSAGLLRPGPGRAAGLLLALGLALFAGDLSARALRGAPLFSSAAPAGGFLLLAGWAVLALGALLPARRAPT